MAFHNDLGKRGEDAAAEFLKKKGYKIIERNWGFGDLEVDIIAQDGDTLVFVEVKTRSSAQWGRPEDAVDEHRKRRLISAANAYLKHHKKECQSRQDIVSVIMSETETKIEHYENAFIPRPRNFSIFRGICSSHSAGVLTHKPHHSTRFGKARKK